MLLNNTTFWVVGFYVFSALNLLFVLWLMRIVGRSKFRSEEGDSTYEVGYEEDPAGNSRNQEQGGSITDAHTPNVVVSDFYNVGP